MNQPGGFEPKKRAEKRATPERIALIFYSVTSLMMMASMIRMKTNVNLMNVNFSLVILFLRLEGLNRLMGISASQYVITKGELTDYLSGKL